jgi:hypothetical protein
MTVGEAVGGAAGKLTLDAIREAGPEACMKNISERTQLWRCFNFHGVDSG